MKNLLDDRKQKIIELIAGNESMTVKDLSKRFNVSEATVRTDLDVLEENGKIVRFHGGARLIENRHKQEVDYQIRRSLNFQNKKKIGANAAEMVDSYDSVVLDASTTSFAMAQALRNRDLKNVTIIPFGLWSAVEFLGYENFDILFPGGYLKHKSASIVELSAVEFVDRLIIQKAFVGAWGVSIENGMTDRDLREVDVKKHILKKAKEVVVMVDGSKFSQSGLSSFGSIDQATKIITDDSAPIEEIDKIRQQGVEVVIA